MIKAVFDTNVLVRIALGRTSAARLLRAVWENGGFALVISEEILGELALVMHYPRIAERYNFTETDWRNFETALRGTASIESRAYISSNALKLIHPMTSSWLALWKARLTIWSAMTPIYAT